jgi:hypothetical protein
MDASPAVGERVTAASPGEVGTAPAGAVDGEASGEEVG